MSPRNALAVLALALAGPALSAEDPVVTPDRAGYVDKVVQEQLDLALAATPGQRMEALGRSANQRVRELQEALKGKRNDLAAALAAAYARTVLEGADALLQDAEQKGTEITPSLIVLAKLSRREVPALDEMVLQAGPESEAAIQKAAAAAATHRKRVLEALDRARKSRGTLPEGTGKEEGLSTEGGGPTPGGDEGLGFDLRDINKKGDGKDEGSSGERRKGRGD